MPVNKGRMVPIAEYSRDCLRALRAETGIDYDERSQGTLQLFRTQKQLDGTADDIAVLKQYGVPYEVLDPAGCIAAEPALAACEGKFVGGLRLPQRRDRRLPHVHAGARRATRRSSACSSGSTRRSSGWWRTAAGSPASSPARGCCTADAYVVALGSYSPRLLKPLGISVPVYPVKGYSITVPITDADGAPVSTVMDETYKVAITRLGDRIRVGGTAEISGYSDQRSTPARRGDARSFADRPVSARRRSGKATLLVRPAADDAGRPAGHRRDALRQPASQHRPRHARLDHGVRFGTGAGRSDVGPQARDRYGGTCPDQIRKSLRLISRSPGSTVRIAPEFGLFRGARHRARIRANGKSGQPAFPRLPRNRT